jgi:hypothetical protein
MRNGFSKTAFLTFAAIIAFGLFGTVVLAIVTAKPVGILVTGGLIFGLLTAGLMAILSDKDWQLNDDFKLTIVRVKKYILPEGVTEEDIEVEEGEEEYVEEEYVEEK